MSSDWMRWGMNQPLQKNSTLNSSSPKPLTKTVPWKNTTPIWSKRASP